MVTHYFEQMRVPQCVRGLLGPALAFLLVGALPVPGDEPIVLELDPETKMPLGPLEAPRGVLLDPRDLPDEIKPYFEIVRDLAGVEASLSALFARSLGFALERQNLDRVYWPHAEAMRDDWNAAVGSLLERVDPEGPEWVAAALYQDTGRRLSEDRSTVTIVSGQRLHLEPIAAEDFERLLELERLIATLGPGMDKEQAQALKDLIEATGLEVNVVEDPWFTHATSQLMFMGMGAWKEEFIYPNPFEISADEFLSRCRRSLHAQLAQPLIPPCPPERTEEGLYFYEGFAVARIAAADDWDAPTALLEHNRATHKPLLLVELPVQERYSAKGELEHLELSMIVAGEERQLYGGKWPLM